MFTLWAIFTGLFIGTSRADIQSHVVFNNTRQMNFHTANFRKMYGACISAYDVRLVVIQGTALIPSFRINFTDGKSQTVKVEPQRITAKGLSPKTPWIKLKGSQDSGHGRCVDSVTIFGRAVSKTSERGKTDISVQLKN
jgi:hypothetical protein